jgi:hypothetical protein
MSRVRIMDAIGGGNPDSLLLDHDYEMKLRTPSQRCPHVEDKIALLTQIFESANIRIAVEGENRAWRREVVSRESHEG